MMRQFKFHLAIAIILIFVYIILINTINFFSSISFFGEYQINQRYIITGSTVEETNLGDSIGLSVLKKRWYGKIQETIDEKGKKSNLYLLGFFKLPLANLNTNYAIYHILFFIAIFLYLSVAGIVSLINYKKYKYYYI